MENSISFQHICEEYIADLEIRSSKKNSHEGAQVCLRMFLKYQPDLRVKMIDKQRPCRRATAEPSQGRIERLG
jgi:hypothetical protein